MADDEHIEFEPTPRRKFMAVVATVLSAALGLIPATIGGLFFLSPALRKNSGGEAPLLDLGLTVDSLPVDGSPVLATVKTDRTDAWSGYPSESVGTVWLRRVGDKVIALNSICPHLGCSVEHRVSVNDFYCPCHASSFGLDGGKVNAIPPRNMDELEVKVEEGRISIRYQNYRAGVAEKVPV